MSQEETSEYLTLWKGCSDPDECYAIVLPPGLNVEPTPFFSGATNRQELVMNVQERYGSDALHVIPSRFERALQRRRTHRRKMLVLLSQYHSLQGDDLRTFVAYGSPSRPLSTNDIRTLLPYKAIALTGDKPEGDYYSFIVVPQFLPEEQEDEYELEFISRPFVMKQK